MHSDDKYVFLSKKSIATCTNNSLPEQCMQSSIPVIHFSLSTSIYDLFSSNKRDKEHLSTCSMESVECRGGSRTKIVFFEFLDEFFFVRLPALVE